MINALVLKPVNKVGEEQCYLGGKPPNVLNKYCEEFAASDTKIVEGPTIMTCKEVGGKHHPFLASDSHVMCVKCQCIVCKYYQNTIGIDKRCYCLLYAATESLVPDIDTESAPPIDKTK